MSFKEINTGNAGWHFPDVFPKEQCPSADELEAKPPL
jgi:hypothetical protein